VGIGVAVLMLLQARAISGVPPSSEGCVQQ
jgi:hypothetical protein